MKNRIYSAIALLLLLTVTVAIDHAFAVVWFSAALIAVVLSMGMVECYTLFRLWTLRLASGEPLGWRSGVSCAVLATGCVGLPGAFLFALRLQEHGLLLLLYLVAVTKMTDNGALFVGRLLGRHKLAPKISPAKTVEGVYGGLVVGVLTATLAGPCCLGLGFTFSLLFGLVISPLAVLGDFIESFAKRKAGVKDAGSLMPGIGGVLDLMDSLLLSAPAGYLLLKTM
jgi:phosphatidate cytidylyltransferase